MSTSAGSKRRPQKSAFSCEPCRKRKVKCDAIHPICDRCRIRGDECVYKLSPTLSYTQRLEQRVEQLEAALAEARRFQSNGSGNINFGDHPPALDGQQGRFTSRTMEGSRGSTIDRAPLNESISLFQLPGSVPVRAITVNQTDEELEARRGALTSTAWRERAFERLTDTPEPFRSLLDSHFCWIQPIFNFVYRPAFTRDMKTGGPYFSRALLNTILSHSVRWCRGEPGMDYLLAPFDDGRSFSKDAVRYLSEDIQHGHNKVPTVQALLLLSAQECGRGNRTQAWLYSGMAFRLIDDMGICVDDQKFTKPGQLSAEEIEIRNRLFWSCYLWDKIISLYFGRSPVIQNSEISPPKVLSRYDLVCVQWNLKAIVDDTAELDVWTPHGLLSSHYPPKQAHSISCFIQVCELAEVLNQILVYLYSPSQNLAPSRAYKYALAAGSKLRDWWRDLPAHLKINLTAVALDCPPSHIVTLNCLYHTINILLNRAQLKLSREPDLAAAIAEHNPLIQCLSSATSIVALFDLYRHAFGEGHVVLALAYSVYTAASIFLLEVQALGHAAPSTLERLALCVDALQRLQETSPGKPSSPS